MLISICGRKKRKKMQFYISIKMLLLQNVKTHRTLKLRLRVKKIRFYFFYFSFIYIILVQPCVPKIVNLIMQSIDINVVVTSSFFNKFRFGPKSIFHDYFRQTNLNSKKYLGTQVMLALSM